MRRTSRCASTARRPGHDEITGPETTTYRAGDRVRVGGIDDRNPNDVVVALVKVSDGSLFALRVNERGGVLPLSKSEPIAAPPRSTG